MAWLGLALWAGLLAVEPAALFAHHGAAAYNLDKSLTLQGTVTQFQWSNPHCLLRFDVQPKPRAGRVSAAGDVQAEGRGVQHWIIELDNPLWLERAGWTAESLKPGDSIFIAFHPTKNGSHGGYLRDEDGKVSVNGKELRFRLPGDNRIK